MPIDPFSVGRIQPRNFSSGPSAVDGLLRSQENLAKQAEAARVRKEREAEKLKRKRAEEKSAALSAVGNAVGINRAIRGVESQLAQDIDLADFLAGGESVRFTDRLDRQRAVTRAVNKLLDSRPAVKALNPEARAIYNAKFRDVIIKRMSADGYTPLDIDLVDGEYVDPGVTVGRDAGDEVLGAGRTDELQSETPARTDDPTDELQSETPARTDDPTTLQSGGSLLGRSVSAAFGGASDLAKGVVDLYRTVDPSSAKNRFSVSNMLQAAGELNSLAGEWVKEQTELEGDEAAAQAVWDEVDISSPIDSARRILTSRGGALMLADSFGFMAGSFGVGGRATAGVVTATNAIRGSMGLAAIKGSTAASAKFAGGSAAGGVALGENIAAPYMEAERAIPLGEYKETVNYERAARYLGEGYSDEQVKDFAIETSGELVRSVGIASSLVSSMLGPTVEMALANPKGLVSSLSASSAKKGATRTIVSRVAAEAGGESIEEALQQGAPSIVNARTLEDIDVEAMGKAGFVGGVFGGAVAGSLATPAVVSAKALEVARKGADMATEAGVDKLKQSAEQGDADAQALVNDPGAVSRAFDFLKGKIKQAQDSVFGDDSNEFNSGSTYESAKSKTADAAGPEGSAAKNEKLSNVDIFTGSEVEIEAQADAFEDLTVPDPRGQLDDIDPSLRAQVMEDGLSKRLTDLNAPLVSKADIPTRTNELLSMLNDYAPNSSTIGTTALELAKEGITANQANAKKILRNIESRSPELAGDVVVMRKYMADLLAVKQMLAATRKSRKPLGPKGAISEAKAVEQGLNLLADQGVPIQAARAKTSPDKISAMDILNQASERVQFGNPTGKARIPRTKGKSPAQRAETRRDILKSRDAETSVMLDDAVTLGITPGGRLDKLGNMLPPSVQKAAASAGQILNTTVRLMQKALLVATNDLSPFHRFEQVLSEKMGQTRESTQKAGAGILEAAWMVRGRTAEMMQRAVTEHVESAAAMAATIRADAAADLGLDEAAADQALDLYPLLNDVAERAKDEMTKMIGSLKEGPKAAANGVRKILTNTDGNGPQLYQQLFDIVNDKNNWADPKEYKPLGEIRVDVTTERMAHYDNQLSVTVDQAATKMAELDKLFGPSLREYTDLVVDGHQSMLQLRIATGDISDSTRRLIEAKDTRTYVPRSRARGQDFFDGLDGEDISFRNKGYRTYQGGGTNNGMRGSLKVLEDAVVSASYNAVEKPLLRAIYNAGVLAKSQGIDGLIEIRPAAPDIFDTARGVMVPQDVPGISETNKFRLMVGGSPFIVTIKDTGMAEAFANVSNPQEWQDLKRALNSAGGKVVLGGGRMVDRANLASIGYLAFTSPTRDYTEAMNEAAKKVGLGGLKQGAVLSAQLMAAERAPILKWLTGTAADRGQVEAELRKRAGKDRGESSVDTDTDAGRAQLMLEFMESGVVTPFDKQIRPDTDGTPLNDDKPASELVQAARRTYDNAASSKAGKAVKAPLEWQNNIMTASDFNARLLSFSALRLSGAGRAASASVARDSLNFQKRGNKVVSSAVDIATIFSSYARTGVLGVGKLPAQFWVEGRAPTRTVQDEDGTLRPQLDTSAFAANISLRPFVISAALTAMRFPLLVVATGVGLSDVFDGDDSDEDKLARGAAVAPRGLGGLPADQLIAANILPIGLDAGEDGSGHIRFASEAKAYGASALVSVAITAGLLKINGEHSDSEINDAVVRVIARNILPAGDTNVANALEEGNSFNLMRQVWVALTPKIIEPFSRNAVNINSFGSQAYSELPGTRDQLFAERDPEFANLDKGTYENIASGYLGGVWKTGEDAVNLAMQVLGGEPADGKPHRFSSSLPGREVTSENYAKRQYSQIMGKMYVPFSKEITEAKDADKLAGVKGKAGPAERKLRQDNPDVYRAWLDIRAMNRRRTLVRKEMDATAEDGDNSAKMKALIDRREQLLVDGLNRIGREHSGVILPLLD